MRNHRIEDRRLMLYAETFLISDSVDMIEEEELLAHIHSFLEQLLGQCREVCRMRMFEGRSRV